MTIKDDRGNDVIAVRPIMALTLANDFRLTGGALAARFRSDLRARLKDWEAERY